MNKARRKQLAEIAEKLSVIHDEIDQISSDELEAFENLPESFQGTEKGESMEQSASDLEEIRDEIEGTLSRINELIGE